MIDHDQTAKDAAFLREAARFFERRPTGGEDATHWANVANAENCRRIATTIESLAAALAEAEGYTRSLLVSFVNEHCDPVAEWAPLPDLVGMLTQFDNAITVCRDLNARATAAEGERDRYKAALTEIAAFGDSAASSILALSGSYGMFDEPGSVEIARQALSRDGGGDGAS